MSLRRALGWGALAGVAGAALALVSRSTRFDPSPGEAADPEIAIESALKVLGEALRSAGTGLPEGTPPVVRLAPGDPQEFRDEGGALVRRRPGTDAYLVRGVLSTSLVALDPLDRTNGAAYAGPGGTLTASAARARLSVPVYPLAFNPPRLWASPPSGLGLRFGPEPGPGTAAPRANEPLKPLLSALRGPGLASFVVGDGSGRFAAARLVSVDGSLLERGCTCAAPAPWPGECPPGRAGCRLELLLDFTARPPLAGYVPPAALGPLAAGGLLEEELFCVAVETSGRSWLARGHATAPGRYAFTRAAENVDDLSVSLSAGVPAGTEARVSITARGASGVKKGASVRFRVAEP